MEILLVDIIIFLTITFLSIKIDRLNFYHPLVWFLLTHFFLVTFRLIQIVVFNQPLLSYYGDLLTHEDIYRAVLMADVGLVFLFIGFCFNQFNKSVSTNKISYYSITLINEKFLKFFLIFCGLVGVYSMSQYIFIPFSNLEFEKAEEKSVLFLANSWLIYVFLVLIFYYGFKKIYLVPLGVLMFIFAFQGESRFRLILPIIFLVALYLKSKNLRWPKFLYILAIPFLFVFVFSPMKKVAFQLQTGGSLYDIVNVVEESYNITNQGENGELMLLDMYASYLPLIDNSHIIYLGETYLSTVYMFIPKSIWPEKPKLTQWMYDISTVSRPMGELGQTPTIYGESYANFRYFGLALIPFFIGFIYGHFYSRIPRNHYKGGEFLLYLVLISIFVQVYRDGLLSLFLFSIINFFPITFLAIFTLITGNKNYIKI